MLPRDYVINQINHIETDKIPYTLLFEADMKEKLDEHFGCSDWNEGLNPYMRHIANADTRRLVRLNDVHHRDAYGCVWRMDKRVWHIDETPLSEPSLKGYKFPEISVFTDDIYKKMEDISKACEQEKDYFKVIDMGWGIFERTWFMRGFENALMDILSEPEFYEELLGRITEIYVGMIKACKDIDADAFLFGDDWGDQRGIIIGPNLWREYIKPCWKKVYDEVHKQSKLVMSHSCGSIHDILTDVIEIGLDVYESVQPEPDNMNPYELKKKFGDRITFWGCLGTQSIVPFGTPDEINAEISKLCAEMGKGGGYILAPTKPLQGDTPIENALAIIERFKNSKN